jgi:hypothetical protein
MENTTMARLSTIEGVIDILGGVDAVARMTGRGETAVYNWRADGRFPASLYVAMTDRLPRGVTAPAELWGQETTKGRRRVAA